MYLLNSFYKKESVVEKHHLQNEDSFKKPIIEMLLEL